MGPRALHTGDLPIHRAKRRTVLLGVLALPLCAAAVSLVATLPPNPSKAGDEAWSPEFAGAVAAGAIHVHTSRSDGAGSVDEIAEAAARAGLQFVIFGDHGDARREPDPPAYRHGVLCIDGVEISTSGGHYLALGMPAAPYRLAGEPRDVVEDVRRLGGFGIVAHPTSAKPALEWTDWTAPFDGIEWLNADSEWRDEHWPALLRLPFDYLIRPPAALASVFDRPELALARWDALTARRRIVGVAAADAHGRIDVGGDPAGDGRLSPLGAPSYEASFRTFAVRVELDRPLGRQDAAPGDQAPADAASAQADAEAILSALRGGRVFSGIDAVARPVRFEFTATSGGAVARMGDALAPAGPVRLRARAAIPPGGEVVLIRDGHVARASASAELDAEVETARAVFRVEVRVPGAPGMPPVPWVVSNPIYIGPRSGEGEAPPARLPARHQTALFEDDDSGDWAIEKDAGSRAAMGVTPAIGGRELAFRYALRGAPAAGQYAALACLLGGDRAAGGVARFDRVLFKARASRLMRLQVQIRQPGGAEGQRWQRSVYLDEQTRRHAVYFDDMVPVGRTDRRRPDLGSVTAILFVVDTTHTPPGTAGVVWLDDVAVAGR